MNTFLFLATSSSEKDDEASLAFAFGLAGSCSVFFNAFGGASSSELSSSEDETGFFFGCAVAFFGGSSFVFEVFRTWAGYIFLVFSIID